MAHLLTPQELEALLAGGPYIPAPTERYHVVIDAGHTDLTSEELSALAPGTVLALDRSAGDPVEIVANAITVARGELVELDGRTCVRVVSLAAPGARSRRTRS
jgi:flagellar motor switch protein FliN/FliY